MMRTLALLALAAALILGLALYSSSRPLAQIKDCRNPVPSLIMPDSLVAECLEMKGWSHQAALVASRR